MRKISARFNCGEFLPGQRPVIIGGIVNTVPPIYIPPPPPPQITPPFPPAPGTPPIEEEKWACRDIEREFCPAPFGTSVASIVKRCIRCTRLLDGRWPVDCIHNSFAACRDSPCQTENFPCPDRYKCVSSIIYCPVVIPPGTTVTEEELRRLKTRVKEIRRDCVICGQLDPDPRCIYLRRTDCEQNCNSEIVDDCITVVEEPNEGDPPPRYECTPTTPVGDCVLRYPNDPRYGFANFDTLAACLESQRCREYPMWKCLQNTCIPTTNRDRAATFYSLEECLSVCYEVQQVKWQCITGTQGRKSCVSRDPTHPNYRDAKYDTFDECRLECTEPDKWECYRERASYQPQCIRRGPEDPRYPYAVFTTAERCAIDCRTTPAIISKPLPSSPGGASKWECVTGTQNQRQCVERAFDDPRGRFATSAECFRFCFDQGGGGGGSDPSQYQPDFTFETATQIPGGTEPPNGTIQSRLSNRNAQLTFNNQIISDSIVVTSESALSKIISILPTKDIQNISLTDNTLGDFNDQEKSPEKRVEEGIYHKYYNFFTYTPSGLTTLVPNDLYLNIFKQTVSKEVKYFLDRQGDTNLPWSDVAISNFTIPKLAMSLRPELLKSLNNINDFGGQLVGITPFLNTIARLLISGKITEFDPQYYYDLERRQLDDVTVNFVNNDDYDEVTRAALGLISDGVSSADFRNYVDDFNKNQIKRQKRLNTDINVRINTLSHLGEESTLKLTDLGLPIVVTDDVANPTTSGQLDVISIGDGAGYYVSALSLDTGEVPVLSVNDASASFYIPPELRYNVLKLLGFANGLNLQVSSVSGQHEFTTSYNSSADIEPMYFALDLDTLKDTATQNSIVNQTSAIFRRLTNEEAQLHAANYSLNTTKVNIDLRDPFIHYARDTSTIVSQQYDVTFRAFEVNRTSDQSILTRNIPFAIILTPGIGAYHNPFSNNSTLINPNSSVITRTISLTADINRTKKQIMYPPLQEKLLYDEIGSYYFGLYEKFNDTDTQDIIYKFDPNTNEFKNSYYYEGSYSNQIPPSSVRTPPIQSQIVGIVDKLIDIYSVSDLTWWDVYRRVSPPQIGEFIANNPNQIVDLLSNSWRGIPIRNVLARLDKKETGIYVDLKDYDKVYITEQDRLNAQNY
jgi:hypothetical protein